MEQEKKDMKKTGDTEKTVKETASGTKKKIKKVVKKKGDKTLEAEALEEEAAQKVVEIDPIDVVRELPDRYNDTRLVLMVRDPQWCFAYWDVADHEAENHRLNDRELHLKVFRLLAPDNMEHKFEHLDVTIGSKFGRWYVMLGMPNNFFLAEIGYYNEHGDFITVVRSNIVYAPRDTLSDVFDDEWMLSDELAQELYGEFDPQNVLSSASLFNMFNIYITSEMSSHVLGGASSSSLGGSSANMLGGSSSGMPGRS